LAEKEVGVYGLMDLLQDRLYLRFYLMILF
jgi:hypothetical protein